MATLREISTVVSARPTSDGAGVSLHRTVGTPELPAVDPFLLLDEFRSDNPGDYIAGFPNHPHRGFETVTIMLAGEMEHRDSRGHTGRLTAGSVQWMTAGRGIIHSEMPKQRDGLMWGFQLWVNLPAQDKMKEPRYQDLPPESVPVVHLQGAQGGGRARLIAGALGDAIGPVQGVATAPFLLDLHLDAHGSVDLPIPADHAGFVYVYDGVVAVGSASSTIGAKQLGVLGGTGDTLRVTAPAEASRALVVTGRPIREPIVRAGPFVMNTRRELEQAYLDYQRGRLA